MTSSTKEIILHFFAGVLGLGGMAYLIWVFVDVFSRHSEPSNPSSCCLTACLTTLLTTCQPQQLLNHTIPRSIATTFPDHDFQGTLRIQSRDPLVVEYASSFQSAHNWIGLYPSDFGGPEHQQHIKDSLLWHYAPSMSGSLQLNTHHVPHGDYTLYYLADDSYRWLSSPINITIGNTYTSQIALLSTVPLVIKYKTDSPAPHNWVALYRESEGAPLNEEFNKLALDWKYASLEDGILEFATARLSPGTYTAYFLAEDGFKWLAPPIEISLNTTAGFVGTLEQDFHYKDHNKILAFKYHTPQPNPKNWIGIWRYYNGGPDHEAFVKEPLLKTYAPNITGTVEFRMSDLEVGTFKVFFLADDSYRWLAEPVATIVRANTVFKPLSTFFTGPSLRVGKPVNWNVAGAPIDGVDPDNYFSLIVSHEYPWAWVTRDGRIIGTPTPDSQGLNGSVDVFVTGAEDVGHNGFWMTVYLPVARDEDPVVQDLKMINLNMQRGGALVDMYHLKQYIWVQDQNVDVLTLQDTLGYHGARLATGLGWHHFQGDDVAILSKYPIVQVYAATPFAAGVRIALEEDKSEIIVWTAHLTNQTYGPTSACVNKTSVEEMMELEGESGRVAQMQEIMDMVKGHLEGAESTPVFLTGDFNSPSHLDWTEGNTHCGLGEVPWPVTRMPEDEGMVDVFRYLNPDPNKEPGGTRMVLEGDGERTDYVFYKGGRAVPTKAQVLVEAGEQWRPGKKRNRWWSDHKAVFAEFKMLY